MIPDGLFGRSDSTRFHFRGHFVRCHNARGKHRQTDMQVKVFPLIILKSFPFRYSLNCHPHVFSHFWGKLFRNTERHQMANNCSYSRVTTHLKYECSFVHSSVLVVSPLVPWNRLRRPTQNRARGYPEPIVTWRREDGNEIVLKDSSGAKQLGECGWKWYGQSMHRHLVS